MVGGRIRGDGQIASMLRSHSTLAPGCKLSKDSRKGALLWRANIAGKDFHYAPLSLLNLPISSNSPPTTGRESQEA